MPGTGILVPEFSGKNAATDIVLKPGGELWTLLEKLATADDTAALIASLPPSPLLYQKPYVDSVSDLLESQKLIKAPCGKVAQRAVKQLAIDVYCRAGQTHNKSDPKCQPSYLKKPNAETAGPRAYPLRRCSLDEMIDLDCVVCEKTDGTRHWLIVTEEGSAYAIDRSFNCFYLPSRGFEQWTSSRAGVHLLDGELIEEKGIFVVFDAIVVSGEAVGALPLLDDRMGKVRELGEISGAPLEIRMKAFRPWHRTAELFAEIVTHPTSGARTHGRDGDHVDGLVFTPSAAIL